MDSSYGTTKWKGGDVLGCMLDYDESNCKMSFSLNGEAQGVAFEYVESAGELFAALSIGQAAEGVFKWKEGDLQHRPDEYSCIELADDAKLDDVFDVSGPITVTKEDGGITMKSTPQRVFPTIVLKGCPLTQVM